MVTMQQNEATICISQFILAFAGVAFGSKEIINILSWMPVPLIVCLSFDHRRSHRDIANSIDQLEGKKYKLKGA
jgi:hypothetical protein